MHSGMPHRAKHSPLQLTSVAILVCSGAFLIWTMAYPFSRAFFLAERDFNEGWNVYNAQKVAEHELLYPAKYDWTSVNYPALSFHIIAALGSVSSEYLFTGRVLSLTSLLVSGLLVALITWSLTLNKFAAYFSGTFFVALFCIYASDYVGMDDPQLLAEAFFLAGLYIYVRGSKSRGALELTALLFVIAGNIKHSLLEFPLAVLLDLLIMSPRKALRFLIAGIVLAALSVMMTSRLDGPAYLSCLLIPRAYSVHKAILTVYGAIRSNVLPTAAAFWVACHSWKNSPQRVVALLLFFGMVVGACLSGGDGVANNMMFGYLIAMVVLTAVFLAQLPDQPYGQYKAYLPILVYALLWSGLALTFARHRNWHTFADLGESRRREHEFSSEVTYVRRSQGAALCESPLVCFYAQKLYLYDAFNAERFIKMGKLDPDVIVAHIRKQEYGAVQMYEPVETEASDPTLTGYFAPQILDAIRQNYKLGYRDQEGLVYVPK